MWRQLSTILGHLRSILMHFRCSKQFGAYCIVSFYTFYRVFPVERCLNFLLRNKQTEKIVLVIIAEDPQRREFRDWIQKVSESVRTKNSEIGIAPMSKSDSAFFMMSQAVSSPAPPSGGAVNSQLQESFTITLGAQMKQVYSLF